MMLETIEVDKHFGGLKAVSKASIKVEKGSITGLIGPNGAGKTTLFNVITGFLLATAGSVYFKKEKINGLGPHQIASKGLVRTFQTPHAFPGMTVLETLMAVPKNQDGEKILNSILWPPKVRQQEKINKEKAMHILERLGMADRRHEMVGNLSAGEARIVELARQLMIDPEMLLLDEPASGINPSMQEKLVEVLKGVRDEGITLMVIDHNLGFIMGLTEYIYCMSNGEVIAQGTPKEMASHPKVREVYLGGEE